MSKYEKLDSAITARIRGGHRFLIALSGGEVMRESQAIAAITGKQRFRIIDARLQAMRRAGKIAYSSRNGWEVV